MTKNHTSPYFWVQFSEVFMVPTVVLLDIIPKREPFSKGKTFPHLASTPADCCADVAIVVLSDAKLTICIYYNHHTTVVTSATR